MNCLQKNRIVVLAFLLLLAGGASQVEGAIWAESGDAGNLRGTAQITTGAFPLSQILGTIDSASEDVDMFVIQITDPPNFSAALSSDELLDTMLFLFDSAGNGVIANDDSSSAPSNPISKLPAGSMPSVALPGLYYLAVSTFQDEPVNSSSQRIFDFQFPATPGEVLATAPPLFDSKIDHWRFDGFDLDAGSYTIDLAGAAPAQSGPVIPEPASVVIWGVISSLGVLFARLRRSEQLA